MTVRRRALVVLAPGPTRDAVRRLVAGVADVVAVASDPFEATARFAEAPADVVVASLEGWRRRDLAFLEAVRARRPAAHVVALVPDGARALVARALASGADLVLRAPVDLDELAATLARLAARRPRDDGPGTALARLASELGHAVNNPLQVASLLLEDPTAFGASSLPEAAARAARTREALRSEIARIRDAVAVVTALGRRSPAPAATFDLGALCRARLEAAVASGLASPAPHRADGVTAPTTVGQDRSPVRVVETHGDADAIGAALDALLRWLAFQAASRPAPSRAVARPSTAPDGRGVEVAARVEGLVLPPERVQTALGEVLCVDEATRTPYPGLALPVAVAAAHGGAIVRKEGRRGTVLALRLPGTR